MRNSNPIWYIRNLPEGPATRLASLADNVYDHLKKAKKSGKLKIYLTWERDVRFGWDRDDGNNVGAYVRWKPETDGLVAIFCAKNLEGFDREKSLTDLREVRQET
jgi:hypothetical protein